jgi:CubicO group peptidase (beta-lactamase class C family)
MKSHRLIPCLMVITAIVCSQASAEPVWPTKGWRTSTPSAQRMDGSKLDAALAFVQKQKLALHGMLVVRHGYIVMEKYFPPYDQDTAHELYSCTKSFVSALTGIAIDKGYIAEVSQPVLGFFPGRKFAETDSRKQAMKVEDLLTMSSGLEWVDAQAYRQLYSSCPDWVKFILDHPMAARPGELFNYNSGNSHILSAIIQAKSGMNTYEFARAYLFGPLGIRDPKWERDPSGIPVGGWGLRLSPREMAKLGYLYLRNGVWDGKQIVPAAWVRDSTRPHMLGAKGLKYGYQWVISPRGDGFAAAGYLGQSIYVEPGLDLVVVFTAQIDPSDPEATLLWDYIMPACKAAP